MTIELQSSEQISEHVLPKYRSQMYPLPQFPFRPRPPASTIPDPNQLTDTNVRHRYDEVALSQSPSQSQFPPD